MNTLPKMQLIPEQSERGYRLCLPRPLPGSFLKYVVERFVERCPAIIGRDALHLYAIADSAMPLCAGILASRHASGLHDRDVLSLIYPRLGVLEGELAAPNEVPILFDNSIRTGRTLDQAINILRNNHQHIRQVVTLIDYADDAYAALAARARVTATHSIEITSLFTASELLENAT